MYIGDPGDLFKMGKCVPDTIEYVVMKNPEIPISWIMDNVS